MATFGSFADLRPAQVELAQRRQANTDPLSALIQGFQMPQQLASQALMSQVKTALAQQQLQDLQNPEEALARRVREAIAIQQAKPFEVGDSLIQFDPVSKQYKSVYTAPTASKRKGFYDANNARWVEEVDGQMVATKIPFAETLGMAPSAPVSIPDISSINPTLDPALSALSSNLTMPTASPIVEAPEVLLEPPSRFLSGTLDQRADAAEQARKREQDFRRELQEDRQAFTDQQNKNQIEYLKGRNESGSMTPAQKISAQGEMRRTYDDLSSKTAYYGKGQVPGSSQIKDQLDAVLNPVKGDFSKLNPQAKKTFVFAMNKLRDPTSATLTTEAQLIAAQSGLGDRLGAFIESYKTGDDLPDQVAKDIYQVVTQQAALHREKLLQQLIEAKRDADRLGIRLTSIGVEKDLQDEVENRINNPGNFQTPTGGQTTRKIGRFELIQ